MCVWFVILSFFVMSALKTIHRLKTKHGFLKIAWKCFCLFVLVYCCTDTSRVRTRPSSTPLWRQTREKCIFSSRIDTTRVTNKTSRTYAENNSSPLAFWHGPYNTTVACGVFCVSVSTSARHTRKSQYYYRGGRAGLRCWRETSRARQLFHADYYIVRRHHIN